ncbi:MAG: anti-sigma factor family protein, partial [Cyclobacteriaceae bacterium]
MSNIELMDDYLTNRLSDSDKAAFENQMATDPALKAEVELQKQIIESVRKARAAELKTMLNQVPVSAPVSFSLPVMRMAASIVGAGAMILAFSYYFNYSSEKPKMATSLEDSIKKVDPADFEPLEEPTAEPQPSKEEVNAPASEQKEVKKSTPVVSPVQQPKIDVVDPTKDRTDGTNSAIPAAEALKSAVTPAQIAV